MIGACGASQITLTLSISRDFSIHDNDLPQAFTADHMKNWISVGM